MSTRPRTLFVLALVSAIYEAAIVKEYTTPDGFAPAFKPGFAQRFVDEVPHLRPEVIACAKDICSYIYDTYGRFPAHVDAFHVPGIWIQAHHLALDYYDSIYVGGYTESQATHDRDWHP